MIKNINAEFGLPGKFEINPGNKYFLFSRKLRISNIIPKPLDPFVSLMNLTAEV